MNKKECEEIEDLINKRYGDNFYVVNYDYYLWVFKISNNEMIMVIHRGNNEYNSYEVKILKVDREKTLDREFDTFKEMKKYLRNNLMDELMVHNI